MYQTITPAELANRHQAGQPVDLIDVRTPVEFREIHIDFARNVPLDRLDPRALQAARNGSAEQPLYIVCRSGKRAAQACEAFVAVGITNVVNLEGGTLAWEAAGLPVVRGAKAMSLERQVRIAAGSLVLLGVALGIGLSPYFFALSAFVGAGLIFSGITDTCGMGILLGRMPWNQIEDEFATKPVSGAACCNK